MPGGNFDYELTVGANGVVDARGPLDIRVSAVTVMCVWVFQKIDEVDAIAYAMGAPQPPGQPGLHVDKLGKSDAHWTFSLAHRYNSPPFVSGSATAMAIGVFFDDEKQPNQTTYWWSEAVTLDVH
jgi:hypothetical protein